MHFSHDFRRAQQPLWSSHYISYDYFKTRVKLGAPIHAELWEQCNLVDERYRSEAHKLADFERQFDSLSRTLEGAHSAALLQFSRRVRGHTRSKAQHLLLFAECNREAIIRILEKSERMPASKCPIEVREKICKVGFYNATLAGKTAYRARRALDPMQDDLPFGMSSEKPELEQAIASIVQAGANGEVAAKAEHLRLVIELAGVDQSFAVPSMSKEAKEDPVSSWNVQIIRLIERYDKLALEDRFTIFGVDQQRSSPLHRAAEYGLNVIVSTLIRSDAASCMLPISSSLANTPSELALCNSQDSTVDLVLSATTINTAKDLKGRAVLSFRLARQAIEIGNMTMLHRVVSQWGVDINQPDERGQKLLCVAIRNSSEACSVLLSFGANVNDVEDSTGKTPLCLACAQGDVTTVEILLGHGADVNTVDARGWLPQEHAAYRGHFPVMRLLHQAAHHQPIPELGPIPARPLVDTDRSPTSHIPWINSSVASNGKTCVWISLGSNDATKSQKAVQLNHYSSSDKYASLQEEVSYSISVYSQEDPTRIFETNLPVLGCQVNKPWLFFTDNVDEVKLIWKLSEASIDDEAEARVVGSGIAMLGTLNAGISRDRESLVRDGTIPLQDPLTLAHVGSVTFSFFWSTPHPPPQSLDSPRYWEFGNGLGGHRGSGKNSSGNKRLQIGENTIQSFSTAVDHGASFLEFDVQLTKDLVPVTYHDFLISETGTDSPMHTLTFEQFEYLSRAQAPRRTRESRSNSFASEDHRHLEALSERMTHTYFNKKNGFKANTRGSFIHEQTCTLEDIFVNVPKAVRMNIEIKYPMLFEADEWEMEPFAIKVELYVDTILGKVYQHAQGRTIVFSSFSPEICIALSTKQRTFPVFFLTKTAAPRGEVRSCCIQQAVAFAKSWGLPGIVTECTPVVRSPRLVQYVKSAGLACTSFGMLNSEPECARIQFEAGIDGVISDSVRAIAELSNKTSTNGTGPVRIYP